MSITINGYKPFLIQKMGSESNPVYDSNAQWGMLVKSFPFQALPDAKEPYKNDWKDESGDEEYVGELKFKAYTMSVEFAMVEDGTTAYQAIVTNVRNFFNYIKSGEFKIYDTYTGIGRQHVRYSGYEQKDYTNSGVHARAIFTIKFKVNDPITNISKPVAIPAIGILHTNGTTYTKDEWTEGGYPSSAAVGVSIISSGHRIILHKSQGEGLKWATTEDDFVMLSDVFTSEKLTDADGDFSGKLNTDAIMAAVSRGTISGAPAAQWCRDLGDEWSMAAVGEYKLIKTNKNEVNDCLSLIGGAEISDDNDVWFSTQGNDRTAWGYNGSNTKLILRFTKTDGQGRLPYRQPHKVRAIKNMSETLSMRVIGPSSISTMNTDYQYSVSFNRTPSAITYMNVACHDSDITISDVTNSGFKLRFNHTYNVKAKDVTVIVYCEAEGQWIVEKRTISVAKVIGIGIQHKDKNIYTKAEWIAKGFYNEEARGVIVSSGNNAVCIYKYQSEALKYSSSRVEVSECMIAATKEDAITDFTGNANTEALLGAAESGTISDAPAALWCRSVGDEWYLPAAGEGKIILDNKTFVDDCMSLIGGTSLPSSFWFSTQQNSDRAWACSVYTDIRNGDKRFTLYTRAVAPII